MMSQTMIETTLRLPAILAGATIRAAAPAAGLAGGGLHLWRLAMAGPVLAATRPLRLALPAETRPVTAPAAAAPKAPADRAKPRARAKPTPKPAPAAKPAPKRTPAPKAAQAAPKRTPAHAASVTPAPQPATPDDLTQLKGVGPKLAATLSELGITRFDQIAGWTATEIDRVEARLDGPAGRIRRDDWVGQARALAGPKPRAATTTYRAPGASGRAGNVTLPAMPGDKD